MSDGIWVRYTELARVNTQLATIVQELNDAASRTNDLEAAIGTPYGKRELRQKVGDFESRWDDKRKELAWDIDRVQKHVQGVLDGLEEWDAQTAASMEVDVTDEHAARPV
ncbi:hypothetical protein [Microbacterium sp. NIBRBAC000506063]|uniref:hypothetical protein n=1 Tax=Microbacterium sp. NIBRBAC000506063 TaxID=2734618 RepID=UPI001BB5A284|nr:hypothetical protein [Microbacterium sp. NIBRBAC000506063]QTV80223.1 hypothetical protein KAE78_04090 [Microbacterium sp. NIBRBAC000506063]